MFNVHYLTSAPTAREIKHTKLYSLFWMCAAWNGCRSMKQPEQSTWNRRLLTSYNLYIRHFIFALCRFSVRTPNTFSNLYINVLHAKIIWPLSKIASLNDNKYAIFFSLSLCVCALNSFEIFQQAEQSSHHTDTHNERQRIYKCQTDNSNNGPESSECKMNGEKSEKIY